MAVPNLIIGQESNGNKNTKLESYGNENAKLEFTEKYFHSIWDVYDRIGNFPFNYKPNKIPFGSH